MAKNVLVTYTSGNEQSQLHMRGKIGQTFCPKVLESLIRPLSYVTMFTLVQIPCTILHQTCCTLQLELSTDILFYCIACVVPHSSLGQVQTSMCVVFLSYCIILFMPSAKFKRLELYMILSLFYDVKLCILEWEEIKSPTYLDLPRLVYFIFFTDRSEEQGFYYSSCPKNIVKTRESNV